MLGTPFAYTHDVYTCFYIHVVTPLVYFCVYAVKVLFFYSYVTPETIHNEKH